MDFQEIPEQVARLANETVTNFQRLPGSAILVRYIKSSYQNDPVRSAVELFLFLFAVRYLLAPKYSTAKAKNVALTEGEIDELVDEWIPEPLVGEETPFEVNEKEKRPVIVGPSLPRSKLSNGRTVTNLATYNFYNFNANETLKEKAIATLRNYGVGPCGPSGFYGTQDVHMKVEADIAAHLGVPTAIIYSQAFSTISSIIPAFAKRGDIIVADKAVNYPIRKGLELSRSTIKWYEHNDMEDLERTLKAIVEREKGRPLTRRFIVTEGAFENVGDYADLPKLVELKFRYKFRLIVDESQSYGVLGRTGRGITEHQNVDANSIDMIVGSMAGPLCAGGGFCAGSDEVVEHQRLSAAAYTFSAALPAMLATTASETIKMLQETPEIITHLRENVKAMRAQLDPRSNFVRCTSAPDNPLLILVLKNEVIEERGLSDNDQELLLQECVDECLANGVMVTRLKRMPPALGAAPKDVGWQAQPAIKVCVTSGLSKKDTEKAGIVIRHAITKVLTRRK